MSKSVLGYRYTPKSISVTFSDGSPVVIASDHPSFDRIRDKLRNLDSEGLWELCQPSEGIRTYFGGRIEIKNGGIFYEGESVRSTIVPTILEMIQNKDDPSHLLRFLMLLQKNPSQHSRDQLWDFVTMNGIVIYSGEPVEVTAVQKDGGKWEELSEPELVNAKGYLVLYKGVRTNFYDQHTGRFLNKPGTLLEMKRKGVDDDQSRHCSNGFHAGSYEYVQSFGQQKLVVLVNPKDVVSVPNDCYTKIRTCRYIVLKEKGTSENFEKITGSTYDGNAYYEVKYKCNGPVFYGSEIVTQVEASSVEEAASIFEEGHSCGNDEILSIVKVRG